MKVWLMIFCFCMKFSLNAYTYQPSLTEIKIRQHLEAIDQHTQTIEYLVEDIEKNPDNKDVFTENVKVIKICLHCIRYPFNYYSIHEYGSYDY